MKRIGLFLFFCFFICQLFAQNRYASEVFTEVNVTSEVVYGRNASIFSNSIFLGNLNPVDLKMDVYEPVGDTYQERPLVLVMHDGNFLPTVINGSIIGSKTDSSVVEICTQLAKRGFTAAAITYRQGWNPLAPTHIDMATSLIQALYRGVQDGRTAIRFFRKNYAEEGNEFHIDPNRITVWGNGTGALIALNMVAISNVNDFVQTTNGVGKFIFDADYDGTPDTPMILEDIHGDIEGKNLTTASYDFFGINEGDTTNFENHTEYNSDFHLSVNVSGAVGDISWLNDNLIPTVSFQSIFDPYFPYEENSLIVSWEIPVFNLQGSKLIGELQESLGNNQAWKDEINPSEPYTLKASSHSATADHPYYEGLYPFINDLNSNGFYEGVVIDWWDSNAASPINSLGMGMPWNEFLHPSGGSFHEFGLLTNENMSAEKARANIDTIMNYFIPRACITLDLSECNGSLFSKDVRIDAAVDVFPNPSQGNFTFDVGNKTIQEIQIYDYNEKQVEKFSGLNVSRVEIDLNHLPKGIYLVQIKLDSGVVTKKLILN